MKNTQKILLVLASLTLLAACGKSKEDNPYLGRENPKGDVGEEAGKQPDSNWFIRDPFVDTYEGVSSERAQSEFSLKNEREIIVAVIDSGVDINHEDLKNKIWSNPGEVGTHSAGQDKSNNGIDDDGNGYVDDVHGWNYLGGTDGRNIFNETLEVTRESARYDKKIASGDTLTDAEQVYFKKVNDDYNQQYKDATDALKTLAPIEAKATAAKKVLKEKLGLEDYSNDKVSLIRSDDAEVNQAVADLQAVIKDYRDVARFYRIYDNSKNAIDYFLNKSYNARAIVGDDPADFSQTHYGNNNVLGGDGEHGTHVAGIIAAERGNGIGINGVAQNVKIMVLRVVPNGDERDKDITLAVRYATLMGAKVINMSFGKSYSPAKTQVDEAFLAASQKGILIFHSAGNDSSNNDLVAGFPNRTVLDAAVKNAPEAIPNWLEIGASAQKRGLNMVASFSDYGKKDVDFFSPGYQMNSSIPGNHYAVFSGTSMASPAAAGVGALLLSNFPTMTGPQAKAILLHETRQYDGLTVHLPGSAALDLPVPFASLSATGGVIDAYRSVKFARDLSN